MITIIAEKPSVAREIAQIVGANSRADGYLHGNGYFVTWAFGHLIGLAMPEAYGFKGFVKENLPIVPKPFILSVKQKKVGKEWQADEGVLKQLQTIQSLFDKSNSIVVATDAGREGELIFRYIYEYLKCKKPFERLWISSLTEKAISDGLKALKKGSDYNNLFLAAKARSEADWLVGINSSQALSISAGKGVFSLGRVQTPTLAMICKRFYENRDFKPVPYWNIKIHTEKNSVSFSILTKDRIDEITKAKSLFDILNKKISEIKVTEVKRTEVTQEAPLLYDLTTLQKDCNRKFNLTAEQTLNIAQTLYEKKFITYPRTGSRYISDDVFDTLPELLSSLSADEKYGNSVQSFKILNKRSVNTSKVTDHHALLPTGVIAIGLNDTEKEVYYLIFSRMLEAFSEKCIKDATNVTFLCENVSFEAKGSIIKQYGWKSVLMEKEDTEEEAQTLPDLTENELLKILKVELLNLQTKAKPLLTESSLLSLMETAGRELENEEERLALKNSGIGTPATRAAIIETLFSRDYISRQKKSLIPTQKGLTVYDIVKDKLIADVSMTGKWENALSKVEAGDINANDFLDNIIQYTQKTTSELFNTDIEIVDDTLIKCPKCKEIAFKYYPKVAKCTKCDCAIFKNVAGKTITDAQIQKLLISGKSNLIKGFRSKVGKPFDAFLKFDENFKVIFDFPAKT